MDAVGLGAAWKWASGPVDMTACGAACKWVSGLVDA